MAPLDIGTLNQAVAGTAAAFRCVTEYQPAGGPGDKVFPPTYEGGKYATERRVDPSTGEIIDCVLLDSVQSQANRMELALLEAWRDKRIDLPVVTVRFDPEAIQAYFQDRSNRAKGLTVTSLEAPHRVADAILRDSLFQGIPFRKSPKGRVLDTAEVRNATGLFGLNPTALVFGLWDSTGPRGGLGAKFQRALVSEMVGFGAVLGCKTSSRIDPLQIMRDSATVYVTDGGGWTLSEVHASKEKGKPVKVGKDGKPSEINHGNIPPTIADGGFTLSYAKQTIVLSLATLRRLRFPLDDATTSNPTVDHAARLVLAALGLLAATLSLEAGADLRSRCQMVASERAVWQLLDVPGEPPNAFELRGAEAIALFNEAVARARGLGLPWEAEVTLTPSEELLRLVARSQELAMHQAEGSD